MTTVIEAHGYEDLRDFVLDNWNFIAVVDDTDTELLRWEVPANPNTQVLNDERPMLRKERSVSRRTRCKLVVSSGNERAESRCEL